MVVFNCSINASLPLLIRVKHAACAHLQESASSASTPVSSARGAALRSGRGSSSGPTASGAPRARVTVTPTYSAPRLAAIVLGRGVIEHYQVRDGHGVRRCKRR